MFEGKANLTVEYLKGASLGWALEISTKYKHSSLLQTFLKYRCKKCYNIGPWVGIHKVSYELILIIIWIGEHYLNNDPVFLS